MTSSPRKPKIKSVKAWAIFDSQTGGLCWDGMAQLKAGKVLPAIYQTPQPITEAEICVQVLISPIKQKKK